MRKLWTRSDSITYIYKLSAEHPLSLSHGTDDPTVRANAFFKWRSIQLSIQSEKLCEWPKKNQCNDSVRLRFALGSLYMWHIEHFMHIHEIPERCEEFSSLFSSSTADSECERGGGGTRRSRSRSRACWRFQFDLGRTFLPSPPPHNNTTVGCRCTT